MDYSKKIIDQQHEKTILENGLTILSVNKDDVDSVVVEVWVKVGSRYESIELGGLSHFIEHMNFKGTSKRSAQQIAEEMDAIGGYLNAYTSRENTVYSAKIMKEYLPLSLDMISDIMFNSTYDVLDIEKEKNVVLQELAQTEDSPEDMVMEYFAEMSFKGQALGRSILGTADNIRSYSQKQIIQFIHEYYIGPRIIVSVAGNVDHVDLVKLVQDKFIPFEDNKEIKREKANYTGGINLKDDKKISQLHLSIGYKGVSVTSEDYYKQEMLAGILGGSISSRLFQEIREKRGLVYSVGSFCQYYEDSGIFGICLSASSENSQELIEVLSNEIKKMIYTISQVEIDRCLAQVRASLFMSRETVDNLAGILASNYSCHNHYISRDEIWHEYKSITIDDLHNLAKKIFASHNNITISALGNIEKLPNHEQFLKMLRV